MNSSLRTLRIVMIGPIASGKGTLSDFIMKEYANFVHISPGNILRREVEKNTPLGKNVQEYLAKGLLVPDKLVVKSVFKELENAEDKNWILDGFPRSLDQALMLHGIIEVDEDSKSNEKQVDKEKETRKCPCDSSTKELAKYPLTAVLNLLVSDKVVIERTSNRWIHLPSGRIYSAGFREPRVKWKDDETGEDLVQRPDDKPEVVKQRLVLYRKITEPVIDFYKNHKVPVLTLHTENSDDVSTAVKYYLDKSLKKQS